MSSYESKSPCALPSSSSTIHPSSLCAINTHSTDLLKLVNTRITSKTVDYVVGVVVDVVKHGVHRPSTAKSAVRAPRHFFNLVKRVLIGAEVTMPILLVALVYLERAKLVLEIPEARWALERVFLGALIVASKYLNDVTWTNIHWSAFSGLFGINDIGRVERQFLQVLDYKLRVSEDDILAHCVGVVLLQVPLPAKPRSTHIFAVRNLKPHYSKKTSVGGRQITQLRHSPKSIHRLVRSADGGWSRLPCVVPVGVEAKGAHQSC